MSEWKLKILAMFFIKNLNWKVLYSNQHSLLKRLLRLKSKVLDRSNWFQDKYLLHNPVWHYKWHISKIKVWRWEVNKSLQMFFVDTNDDLFQHNVKCNIRKFVCFLEPGTINIYIYGCNFVVVECKFFWKTFYWKRLLRLGLFLIE